MRPFLVAAALSICVTAAYARGLVVDAPPARVPFQKPKDLLYPADLRATPKATNSFDVAELVDAAARDAGVPVHLAHAVVQYESNYNPARRGRAGEWGLGQIKCQTARGVGFKGDCSALADAETNLTYSMKYLRAALDRGGYNCAGVSLYQSGARRPHCSAYGRSIMALAGYR